MEASDQFQLNIAISLAVADFADHYLSKHEVWIKWPNDIYVGGRKVAGILVQNSLKGKVIDSTIVGTGININQVKFSADIPNPTSLQLETGEPYQLDVIMPWLFRFLTKRYLQLKAGMHESMLTEYLERLYRRGLVTQFAREDGSTFEATIQGVDAYGKLIVRHLNGELESFGFREIKLIH